MHRYTLGVTGLLLVANGDSVPARGQLMLGAGLDLGNCETGPFSGTIAMDDDGEGGTFQLVDLHAAPPCTGVALSGTVTGCFKSEAEALDAAVACALGFGARYADQARRRLAERIRTRLEQAARIREAVARNGVMKGT